MIRLLVDVPDGAWTHADIAEAIARAQVVHVQPHITSATPLSFGVVQGTLVGAQQVHV